MGTIEVFDEADRFRIEIVGRLAGEVVDQVAVAWSDALRETTPRSFTVDISQLNGYDRAGFRLLREIYRHGTHIAARNADALAFLNEISSPERPGPRLIYRMERERKPVGENKGGSGATFPLARAAAAGK